MSRYYTLASLNVFSQATLPQNSSDIDRTLFIQVTENKLLQTQDYRTLFLISYLNQAVNLSQSSQIKSDLAKLDSILNKDWGSYYDNYQYLLNDLQSNPFLKNALSEGNVFFFKAYLDTTAKLALKYNATPDDFNGSLPAVVLGHAYDLAKQPAYKQLFNNLFKNEGLSLDIAGAKGIDYQNFLNQSPVQNLIISVENNKGVVNLSISDLQSGMTASLANFSGSVKSLLQQGGDITLRQNALKIQLFNFRAAIAVMSTMASASLNDGDKTSDEFRLLGYYASKVVESLMKTRFLQEDLLPNNDIPGILFSFANLSWALDNLATMYINSGPEINGPVKLQIINLTKQLEPAVDSLRNQYKANDLISAYYEFNQIMDSGTVSNDATARLDELSTELGNNLIGILPVQHSDIYHENYAQLEHDISYVNALSNDPKTNVDKDQFGQVTADLVRLATDVSGYQLNDFKSANDYRELMNQQLLQTADCQSYNLLNNILFRQFNEADASAASQLADPALWVLASNAFLLAKTKRPEIQIPNAQLASLQQSGKYLSAFLYQLKAIRSDNNPQPLYDIMDAVISIYQSICQQFFMNRLAADESAFINNNLHGIDPFNWQSVSVPTTKYQITLIGNKQSKDLSSDSATFLFSRLPSRNLTLAQYMGLVKTRFDLVANLSISDHQVHWGPGHREITSETFDYLLKEIIDNVSIDFYDTSGNKNTSLLPQVIPISVNNGSFVSNYETSIGPPQMSNPNYQIDFFNKVCNNLYMGDNYMQQVAQFYQNPANNPFVTFQPRVDALLKTTFENSQRTFYGQLDQQISTKTGNYKDITGELDFYYQFLKSFTMAAFPQSVNDDVELRRFFDGDTALINSKMLHVTLEAAIKKVGTSENPYVEWEQLLEDRLSAFKELIHERIDDSVQKNQDAMEPIDITLQHLALYSQGN